MDYSYLGTNSLLSIYIIRSFNNQPLFAYLSLFNDKHIQTNDKYIVIKLKINITVTQLHIMYMCTQETIYDNNALLYSCKASEIENYYVLV